MQMVKMLPFQMEKKFSYDRKNLFHTCDTPKIITELCYTIMVNQHGYLVRCANDWRSSFLLIYNSLKHGKILQRACHPLCQKSSFNISVSDGALHHNLWCRELKLGTQFMKLIKVTKVILLNYLEINESRTSKWKNRQQIPKYN